MAMRQSAKSIAAVVVAAMLIGSGWLGLHVPTAAAAGGTVWYVSTTGDDANAGDSWAEAFATLQRALDKAEAGDEIWIAAGTYYPTKQIDAGDPRTATFQLENGVAIYGGFKGNDAAETVATRDLDSNRTILSGDLARDDDGTVCTDTPATVADNAYHVFHHPAGLNLDQSAILDGVTIRGGYADIVDWNFGGGMHNNGSSPHLENVIIECNYAVARGGGLHNQDADTTLTNVTIRNNRAGNGGGGVANFGAGTVTFDRVTIEANRIVGGGGLGGGMLNEGPDVTIVLNDTVIAANEANQGAGMHNSQATVTMTGGRIDGNKEGGTGGGVYSTMFSALTLDNVAITNNEASRGAGIFAGTLTTLTLTNVTITGNTAGTNWDDYGAGILAEQATVTMSGGRIANNVAEGGSGGGIYQNQGTVTLTGVTVENNAANGAAGAGGGVYNSGGTLTLTDATIANNSAKQHGGGIITSYFAAPAETRFVMQGGSIRNNSAGHSGGGLYNQATPASLSGVVIADNTAVSGGGVHHTDATASLTNVRITGNSATMFGGGMQTANGSELTLTNVLIAGNESQWTGGAMYNNESTLTLTNVTVAGNFAQVSGGGITNDKSSPVIRNTIVWGNGDPNGASAFANDGDSVPKIAHSIIEGAIVADNWIFGVDDGGNMDTDPLFAALQPASGGNPTSAGDYRLQAGSPAIDAGDNAAIAGHATDLAGKDRIVNGTVDIGAYEYTAAPAPGGPPGPGGGGGGPGGGGPPVPSGPFIPADPDPFDPPAADPPAFTDVDGHWAAADLTEAAALGFVSGYPDGTFRPDATISRLEFAVIMVRVFGLSGDGATPSFPDWDDVPDWAAAALALAIEEGMLAGFADGLLHPGENVNRAQMAVMVARALDLPLTETDTAFADDDDIPDWARPYVAAVHAAGLMVGQDGNRFAPEVPATRAEAIALLMRIWQHLNA